MLNLGMNGVLIKNHPSLFTCDEMNDEALIKIKETGAIKKWKDIRLTYKEWKFGT